VIENVVILTETRR